MNNLSRTLLLCTIFLTVTITGNAQEKGGGDLEISPLKKIKRVTYY